MATIDTANSTNAATFKALQDKPQESKNATLQKDDFMKLLLVELQNQDPTEPMDSEKILSQTSQLATLESADNTNQSLSELATSLNNSNQFSTISAIGKIGDLGNNSITLESDGSSSAFELYFKENIDNGYVDITDTNGNSIKNILIRQNEDTPENIDVIAKDGSVLETLSPVSPNVYRFNWDGITDNGNNAEKGAYQIEASASTSEGKTISTKLGAYPIESVKFDNGKASVKIGSAYVPFTDLKEVY